MSNAAETRGFNENGLQDSIMQLYEYAEKLKSTLNLIDELQYKVKECYKSDNSKEYQQRFAAFRNNFDVIVGYIEGYAVDLNKVRLYHSKIVDSIVTDLNKKIKEDDI